MPCTRAITGFGHVSNRAQQRLRALRERGDAVDLAVLDVADEETDVGAGDEGLAGRRDHDALDRRIRCGLRERVLELSDHVAVDGVQRVGTIDRQRGDAVGDLGSNHGEA